MKSISKYYIPILLSFICFSTFAESTKDDFEQFLEQEVSLSSLRKVGYKAGEMWPILLQAHRGEVLLSRTDAETFVVKLIDLDMCLNQIHEEHPYEPDIKSAYFVTLDDSVLYVEAVNSLGRLIGDDDSHIQKLVSNVICGQYLSPEELKI
ncbi:hypothetical protein L4D20_11585 [Vibrio kyushuensis]|uniref:hypothetical protein n=1 Tax=Vibrio kyushuensis TaxID=2910249 RepID=UPI003D130010